MRKTTREIKAMKGGTPVVCLTAYTAPMAELLDLYCDVLLVGDSVGMVLYGMKNTVKVSLEMMVQHGQAVMRRVEKACVVVDMPFGTYEDSPEQALENARHVIEQTGCDAVKLEGGSVMADTIRHLTDNNISVMGHIGLLPQSVEKEGGYKIKGKTQDQAEKLIEDATALEEAGVFAMVIEGTIETVGAAITRAISVPTIGIGASSVCDGQILVTEDMLGMLPQASPKFVKEYADLKVDIESAAQSYADEVRSRAFPTDEHTYKG